MFELGDLDRAPALGGTDGRSRSAIPSMNREVISYSLKSRWANAW
jgi:hypothetical protein